MSNETTDQKRWTSCNCCGHFFEEKLARCPECKYPKGAETPRLDRTPVTPGYSVKISFGILLSWVFSTLFRVLSAPIVICTVIGMALGFIKVPTEHRLRRLGQVLKDIPSFSWTHSLYLRKDEYPWNETSYCTVLFSDDSGKHGTAPPAFASDNGMDFVINIRDAQDIINNANEQLQHSSVTQLVEAFNYYIKHDEFINF